MLERKESGSKKTKGKEERKEKEEKKKCQKQGERKETEQSKKLKKMRFLFSGLQIQKQSVPLVSFLSPQKTDACLTFV